MNARTLLASVICLFAAACGDKVDLSKVYGEIEANNQKTCECKDPACVEAATNEHGKLMAKVAGVDKDRDATSKLAELTTKNAECVTKVMAAAGKK